MFEWLDSLEHIENMEYGIACIDLKTGESYVHNGAMVTSSASIIKLPIMAAVFKLIEQKQLEPHMRITIDKKDRVAFSILTLLDEANSYSLLDLVLLMIIQSDNTATNILIDLVGMEYINQFISEIGLKNTVLRRKMLDFTAKRMGWDNLTTAYDMASFMQQLYNGKLASSHHTGLMLEILKNQLDRSSLYLNIPDETVIAHKSGQLNKCEHEVGILYGEKSDIAFSIMTWNAQSNNQARRFIGEVASEIYNHFKD